MFSRILVPLDQSTLAEEATGPAAALARASKGEIDLVLAHETPPYDGVLASSWNDMKTPEESAYIRALADEISKGANIAVDGRVEIGNAVDAICRRVREMNADLIVMTSHGRTGLSRAWLGSVADGVVREASVPVLMLRPVDERPRDDSDAHLFQRILVPLDGSTTSAAILGAASKMARASGGTLMLARIVTPVPSFTFDMGMQGMPVHPMPIVDDEATRLVEDGAREELANLARSLEQDGLKVETEVVMGSHVAADILELAKAKDADLIAMTTSGRGASRLVVGSVTDKVLRGSSLPLLLLHPQAAAVEKSVDAA